jgi:hypothetical protein
MIPLEFFTKQYKSGEYECFHFARDLWRYLTGKQIEKTDFGLLSRKGYKLLQYPVNPCLAFYGHLYANIHMGVYVDGVVYNLAPLGMTGMLPVLMETMLGKARYYGLK